MPKGQCVFNLDWMDPGKWPDLAGWILRGSSVHQIKCKFCIGKDIDIGAMGISAVKSHAKAVKHIKNCQANNNVADLRFFSKTAVPSTESRASSSSSVSDLIASTTADNNFSSLSVSADMLSAPSTSSSVVASAPQSNPFVNRDNDTKAEIIWTLFFVGNHFSYRSCIDLAPIIRLSLPDSEIGQRMTLSKTKISYMVAFGLSPYFKNEIIQHLNSSDVFVACFDEAYNKISKKCQLDIWVRYWDKHLQQVASRYLNSVFMGHSTAADILDSFKKGLDGINISKIIQISRDGPNVNWKFINDFQQSICPSASDLGLLEIGSCGLHVVHGAFKLGHRASGWDIDSLLRHLFYLFNESPARSEDFERITNSTKFAKKFCSHRWLENSGVVSAALDVIPNYKKYVDEIMPKPHSKSFDGLVASFKDKYLFSKLHFFQSVANLLEPFLRKFQSAEPMTPFLADELESLLRKLLRRFVKESVLTAANTTKKLLAIDLSINPTNTNLKNVLQVDISLPASNLLPKLNVVGNSELQRRSFYDDCRKFLSATASKIIEKSPLKYGLTRGLSALSPLSLISSDFEVHKKRFDVCLTELINVNRISATSVNLAQDEYYTLFHSPTIKKKICDYKLPERLDDFWQKVIGGDDSFANVWKCFQVLLILSHGNASVESGFSVNEDLLVPNLQQRSLISQRLVYDKIISVRGLENIPITAEMIKFVRGSSARCKDAEEDARRDNVKDKEKNEKRKRELDELKELKQKVRRLDEMRQQTEAERSVVTEKINALTRRNVT